MVAPPLRVEGLTDADFNARAPIPIDELPSARDVRIRQNTWIMVGALVSTYWLTLGPVYIPFGLVLSITMGLLVRETAKTARENFPTPMYLLVSLLGAIVGVATVLYAQGKLAP